MSTKKTKTKNNFKLGQQKRRRREQRKRDIIIIMIITAQLVFIVKATPYAINIAQATAPAMEFSQSLPINEDMDNLPVKEQIRRIAIKAQFPWIDYLLRLATCENDTFDPNRDNSWGNYPADSTDHGIFMINDYWHAEVSQECSHNVECSTKWTMQRILDGYQHEWTCNDLVLNNPDKHNY